MMMMQRLYFSGCDFVVVTFKVITIKIISLVIDHNWKDIEIYIFLLSTSWV